MNTEKIVTLAGNLLMAFTGLYLVGAMEAAFCGGTPLSNVLDMLGIGWR